MEDYLVKLDGVTKEQAEVLASRLAKEGIEEPSDMGFLCLSGQSVSDAVVHKLCGDDSGLARALTAAVTSGDAGRKGQTPLLRSVLLGGCR